MGGGEGEEGDSERQEIPTSNVITATDDQLQGSKSYNDYNKSTLNVFHDGAARQLGGGRAHK